jgi:hypothetical protein
MNQAKTKRPYSGDRSNNRGGRTPGPKARVINLREKGTDSGALVEVTVEGLKRFYQTVDTLRFGNYKTGFNTYQYGLVIVEGFNYSRIEDSGFTKVTGTLFGLVKADDYFRLASSRAEPALVDYEQAIFLEDGNIIHNENNETKVSLTKFHKSADSTRFSIAYRSTEHFIATIAQELFALEILPQFRKDVSAPGEKEEVRQDEKPARVGRPPMRPKQQKHADALSA